MSNVVSIHSRQEKVWTEFVEAQRRAIATLSMEDGLAARRAWQKWLGLNPLPTPGAAVDGGVRR